MGAHENASVSDRRLYERVRWHHRSGRSSIWLPRFSVTCDGERRLAPRSVEHARRPLCRESNGTCMGQTRHTAPALGPEPGSERGQTWCVSDLAVLAISDTHRSERCVHSVDLVATTGSQTQVREILGNQILDPLRTRQTLPVRALVAGEAEDFGDFLVGDAVDRQSFTTLQIDDCGLGVGPEVAVEPALQQALAPKRLLEGLDP